MANGDFSLRIMHRKAGVALAVAFMLALVVFPSMAATLPTPSIKPDPTAPVLLEADRFGYDTKLAMVIAEGNAEVIQKDYIVLAQRITYDQNTGVVRAQGNVTVSEPNGNVYFAENVVLENEVKTGVIYNFRARLADNSLFAAREARKVSPSVTEMTNAVYSGCKVCTETGDKKEPFWQIKAEKITYDETEQRIKYRNAMFELFGVPIIYTPFFAHASPGAERKSGFLMPTYELSGHVGAKLSTPYYWNIAPNKDAVLTPIYTSDEGPVMAGTYRHLLTSGSYELGGSATLVDRISDDSGVRNGGTEWRGHMEGNGRFRLSDFWRWGFDGKYASDDTYLRRYEFGNEDLLTSKVFLQGHKGRTMSNIEAIGFQGLRARDDSNIIPVIHPLADVSHESQPGWEGSRFGASGNVMALSRDVGPESRRLSSTAYWRVPYITEGGHIVEMRTQMRTDLYSVDNQFETTTGGTPDLYSGLVGRVVPELWMDWRYPLLKRLPASSLIIEPTVAVATGLNGINSNKIPNEDNLGLEFSDANLFSANHYPGFDLVESGTRVSYGIRSQWNYDGGSNVNVLFGQNYHTDNDNLFPYSNDLSQELSDYVGRAAWDYSDMLQLAYRFRMDRETMELKRSEVGGRLYFDPVTLQTDYVRLDSDPYLEDNEEIRASGSLRLTDNWTWTTLGRRNLGDDEGMIRAGTGLVFQNECVTVNTSVNRQYIRDRDVEPSTSVKLEVFLKNLN